MKTFERAALLPYDEPTWRSKFTAYLSARAAANSSGAPMPFPEIEIHRTLADAGESNATVTITDPPVPAPVTPPTYTSAELSAQALAALNGGGTTIDIIKLLKAKVISDLAFRLGKAPGALTAADLQDERTRIANIYAAL